MYIKVFLACYNNIHHTASKCAVAGFDKYNAFDVLIILCIGMLLPGTPWVCTKLSASPALCAPNSYLGSPKLSQKPSSVWRRTWVYFLCCLWFSEANFYNIFIFNLGSQMLQNSFVNIFMCRCSFIWQELLFVEALVFNKVHSSFCTNVQERFSVELVRDLWYEKIKHEGVEVGGGKVLW